MNIKSISLAAAVTFSLAACGGGSGGATGPSSPGQPEAPPSTPPAASSATVEASATANVFTPGEVTIAVGKAVTWAFGGRPHNVDFEVRNGAPADIPTTTNAEVARTFNTAGTFPYDCTIHPGMSGTVKVQ